ncbi:MAG: aldo/keto reductase [Tannerellaceae bacterium]|nr:aldo/keto reductase [Tannerellaceae bacterium]
MKAKQIDRRDFLARSSMGLIGAGIGFSNPISTNGKYLIDTNTEEPKIKEYRVLGRTGFKVSDIGCGSIGTSNENVIKAIISGGVNLIDTAESYANGNNERMVGRAIKGFQRKSIFINTKISVPKEETEEGLVLRVKKCLERLDTDYIDGLMIWNASSVSEVKNKVFQKAFQQLKKEGLVKYSGISCHGSNWDEAPGETMEKVVGTATTDGRFDIVMFVHNYVQKEMGEIILKECAKKNIGTLLMKTDPFGGNYLSIVEMVKNYNNEKKPIPEDYQKIYDRIIERQTKAESFLRKDQIFNSNAKREAAISFALSNPLVHSALITFKNFDDVTNYINLSGIRLTEKTLTMINLLKNYFGDMYCRHACNVCEDKCPYNVPVNRIMRYNHYFMAQSREKYAIKKYHDLHGSNAEICMDCEGYCEASCPYSVKIQGLLTIAHHNLSLNIS